jgi:hypothetical protein
MDKKEVAALSLQRSFNKKWWDKHRSFKIRGSGTGEALADWQQHCPEDVAQLKDPADVIKAESTCEALRKTLKVASGKCDKSDEEMLAAIKKMQKLIDEYELSLLNLKKAQTNKYTELNKSLQEIIDAARHFLLELPALAKSVNVIQEEVERIEERVEHVEQMDKSDKKALLLDIATEQKQLKGIDERLATMAKDMKNLETPHRNAIFDASKDAKFRPTLEKFRTGTAEFDRGHAEIYDLATDMAGRLGRAKLALEKGETVEGVIEEINKMLVVLEGAVVGHFRETLDVMKERTPKVMEFAKDPKSLTPRNWQDLALWEDDAKGAVDKNPTTSRMLDGLLRDIKKYGDKYGRNPKVKPLINQAIGLYQARIKEREVTLKFADPYRKQIQALLEKNHA